MRHRRSALLGCILGALWLARAALPNAEMQDEAWLKKWV